MSHAGRYRNMPTAEPATNAQRHMMSRWRSSLRCSISDIAPLRSSGLFRRHLQLPHGCDGPRAIPVGPGVAADPSASRCGGRSGTAHDGSFGVLRVGVVPARLRIAAVSSRMLFPARRTAPLTSVARRTPPGRRPELVERLSHVVVGDLRRHRVADLVLHVAELSDHPSDRAGELGQPLGPHHDQCHGEDDEELEGSYVEHRVRDTPGSESIGGPCRGPVSVAEIVGSGMSGPERCAALSAARAEAAAISSAIGWSSSCIFPAVRPSRMAWRTRNPSITRSIDGGHETDDEPDDEPGSMRRMLPGMPKREDATTRRSGRGTPGGTARPRGGSGTRSRRRS